METAFFLPVGKQVIVFTSPDRSVSGELHGLINLAGIPAIWILDKVNAQEHIVPLIQVHSITVSKQEYKILS